MNEDLTLYDKLHLHLFEGKETAKVYLSEDELDVKRRVEAVFTKMLDDPLCPECEIRTMLKMEFNISIATAYRDIALTKTIFGNFQRSSKEYSRYRINAYLEWAADRAKNKDNEEGVIRAATSMGKFALLDQSDSNDIPWQEVIPPSFEPTNDIEVLGDGFKRDPNINKTRQKLYKKYFAEDATIIE